MAEGEGVKEIPAEVGRGLGHHLGPLPVWGWVVGVAVVGGGIYWYAHRTTTPSASDLLGSTPLGGMFGSGGGSSGSAPPVATTAAPTNASWLPGAAQAAAQALNLPVGEVQTYLQSWLNGAQIPGSTANSVVAWVTSNNPPPSLPTSGSGAPFLNNQGWWTAAQSFVNQANLGISSAVQTELNNWFASGGTNTLSQDAQTALGNLQQYLGGLPTPWTITTTPPPAPPAPPPAPTLAQFTDAILSGVTGGPPAAIAHREQYLQAEFSDLTRGQVGQLSTAFHTWGGGGGGPVPLIIANSWLSQIRQGQGDQLISQLQQQFNYK